MNLAHCQILVNGSYSVSLKIRILRYFFEFRIIFQVFKFAFQDFQQRNIIEDIAIPCPMYPEFDVSHCALITYVDPMDKCLDINITNNMDVLPFKLNTSTCPWTEQDQCKVYPDLFSKGEVA